MAKSNDEEKETGDKGSPGILGRVGAAAGAAKQSVRRSAEVMSGADIRRFEEFTDAATTAVIGVHRDQTELREQLARTEQSVHALQQEHTTRRGNTERVKQSPSPWVIASGAVSVVALALSIVALLL